MTTKQKLCNIEYCHKQIEQKHLLTHSRLRAHICIYRYNRQRAFMFFFFRIYDKKDKSSHYFSIKHSRIYLIDFKKVSCDNRNNRTARSS